MPDLRSRSTQVLLGAAVLILVLVAMGWNRRARQERRLQLEAAVGAVPLYVQAPNITLFPRSEEPVKLDSYRGRVVFVNFWATWCGPCVEEMPSLIALHDSLDPADIAFVSIAEDDFWPPVDAWLAKNPLPFDVYRDRPRGWRSSSRRARTRRRS